MLAPEPRRVAQMDGTLVMMRTANRVSTGTTILYLLDGAAYLTLGTVAAFDNDAGSFAPPGGAHVAFSAGSLLIGTQILLLGIRAIAANDDGERLARFRRQRADGTLDARALARYEGELRDAASSARLWRLAYGWGSLGVAAAGQSLIGLTAAADVAEHDDSRVWGYVFGSMFLVAGTFGAYVSFAGSSPTERLWKRYKVATQQEPLFDAELLLAPWGSHGFVLGSTGRF